MKVTFFSNFLNHHQLPFSQAMLKKCDYHFVANCPLQEEQRQLGYADMNKQFSFVIATYEGNNQKKQALKLAEQSDVMIIGGVPYMNYLKKRLAKKLIIFGYYERIFKQKQYKILPLRQFASVILHHTKFLFKPMYMLCASAYASADFAKGFAYLNKCYKWGYFPETVRHEDMEFFLKSKEPGTLLWVGRLIDWKHPELALQIAERLKKEDITFKLRMIGTGKLLEELKQKIVAKHLEDCIELLGSMPPEQVRVYMEKSQIFLFTSDFNEGWGAVLNESMNSGCAVVASHAIGSVPYLLKNGKNGFIYKNGDFEELYKKTKQLLMNQVLSKHFGENAYSTIINEWNAEVAAERFLVLAEHLKQYGKCDVYKDGPCSPAQKLKNDWFEEDKNDIC